MVQIILLGFIIFLGAFIFKCYPLKKDVKVMMDSALFIVIIVLLNRLSIMVPLFGVESLQIGFEGLALMIAGLLLPPSYAFLVAICVDMIGLIIVPTGFPFFGFTLNSILQCLIPSLLNYHSEKIRMKKIGILCLTVCGALFVSSMLYIFSVESISVSGQIINIGLNQKITFMCFVVCVFIMIFIGTLVLKKNNQAELHSLYIWIFIVIIVQLLVVFTLTPLWLDYMYGIPFMVSFFIRVVKGCVMIPLEIIIGFSVYKILRKA